jgi:sugar lactone lactonase YvrE
LILLDVKREQNRFIVAGGYGSGYELNQLYHPHGIFIDADQTIYIADRWNNRIVQWKYNAISGQIVAGENGRGKLSNQLCHPVDVIIDKHNNFIISDRGNRRVVRLSRQNNSNEQVVISDIKCYGLTMDKKGYLYVSDSEKNEVRRWKIGDKNGIVAAGGNGKGASLNQLNNPTYIFIGKDDSLYVSDCDNHRVIKWKKDATEGIVVAGGNGDGKNVRQLSDPHGVIVDQFDQIYVADHRNHRVMCWLEGAREGSIFVGGNREQSSQFYYPTGLSFDRQGNLYVADMDTHRIQKFEINLN